MNIIHRGIANKKLKENCFKSFKESFNKKYGIETDIHFTKDNKIICFHDFTLNRLFKINKSIKNLTYDEIKNYKNCIIISFKHTNLFKILKINNKVKIGFSFAKNSKISDIIKTSSKKNYDCLILDKYFINNKSIQNIKKNKYFYTVKEKKEFLKYSKNYNLIFENL